MSRGQQEQVDVEHGARVSLAGQALACHAGLRCAPTPPSGEEGGKNEQNPPRSCQVNVVPTHTATSVGHAGLTSTAILARMYAPYSVAQAAHLSTQYFPASTRKSDNISAGMRPHANTEDVLASLDAWVAVVRCYLLGLREQQCDDRTYLVRRIYGHLPARKEQARRKLSSFPVQPSAAGATDATKDDTVLRTEYSVYFVLSAAEQKASTVQC